MKKVNKVSNDHGGGSYSRYPNIPPEVGGQLYVYYICSIYVFADVVPNPGSSLFDKCFKS